MKNFKIIFMIIVFAISISCAPALMRTSYIVEEGSLFAGQAIRDLDLKNRYDVNILRIKRDGKLITNPSPEVVLQTKDTLYLFGDSNSIAQIEKIFK